MRIVDREAYLHFCSAARRAGYTTRGVSMGQARTIQWLHPTTKVVIAERIEEGKEVVFLIESDEVVSAGYPISYRPAIGGYLAVWGDPHTYDPDRRVLLYKTAKPAGWVWRRGKIESRRFKSRKQAAEDAFSELALR